MKKYNWKKYTHFTNWSPGSHPCRFYHTDIYLFFFQRHLISFSPPKKMLFRSLSFCLTCIVNTEAKGFVSWASSGSPLSFGLSMISQPPPPGVLLVSVMACVCSKMTNFCPSCFFCLVFFLSSSRWLAVLSLLSLLPSLGLPETLSWWLQVVKTTERHRGGLLRHFGFGFKRRVFLNVF